MISRIGVPSIKSAPETSSTCPSVSSRRIPSSRTAESPIGFGRNGERVANTPMRVFPPRRGGRTVGDQLARTASENSQMSQICEKPSIPRSASGLRYSGSKTSSAFSSSTSPLWRGMPNLEGKSLRMRAMIFSSDTGSMTCTSLCYTFLNQSGNSCAGIVLRSSQ